MKTKLLFTFLCVLGYTTHAQTLDSADFNSLTLGNFATDITGDTAGQGGFFIFASNGTDPTTTTNADASNLQVVAAGNNGTQGAQLTTPNGNKGTRILFKSIESEWTARTTGNDIVQLEFAFFTGAPTTSRSPFRATVIGLNGATTVNLVALQYSPVNSELFGLATLLNNGTVGFFRFNLGPANTPLILPPNTWFDMGASYNSVTGELIWKSSFNDTNVSFSNAANVITGMVPQEVDFLSFGIAATATTPANMASVNYIFDDYRSSASSSDTLLSVGDVLSNLTNVRIFPNPVENLLKLTTSASIKEVTIFNNLGQVVLTRTKNFGGDIEFDVSEFNSGLYMMTIISEDGKTETKKFIKN